MFDIANMPGVLVPIKGTDPVLGPWEHRAFLADPLPEEEPSLSGATYREVANARAALANLASTAQRLENPRLLRRPALTREAQSTSALEGTYAPLADVLQEDEQAPSTTNLREIWNYVLMADQGFAWLTEGRPLTVGMLCDLQKTLVSRTPSQARFAGELRGEQVVIGRRNEVLREEMPAIAARFVPAPPGLDLDARVRDLVIWISDGHEGIIDPVVATAMAHYQFETLHPFWDGNGRVGRLLIVMQLLITNTLSEPTLSVSPWFEERRAEYYDRLLAISCQGNAAWDGWVRFFARGLASSARSTQNQMLRLLDVQKELHSTLRSSALRSDKAHALVDLAVARPSFTTRQVESQLGVSYGRANAMIAQLCALGILEPVHANVSRDRRFQAPRVREVLLTS